ncbi:MAG: DUF1646 family protein [Elusimicrobia bacterium]|nr:DUF1646 family protein [Elusimicrobiota bacterium]
MLAEALTAPLPIAAAILLFGIGYRQVHDSLRRGIEAAARRFGARAAACAIVIALGLLSCLVTVVVAALALAEAVGALGLSRKDQVRLAVLGCFAIGLGSALTRVGGPVSAIAVARLSGPPYQAGPLFLLTLLGPWVLPVVLLLGILAAVCVTAAPAERQPPVPPESIGAVALRAAKVYFFVAALVILGEAIRPLMDRWASGARPATLYWVNLSSAVLDNATLAAAEVNPGLDRGALRYCLLGLLISGGMLVPGNIPNIICASRLGITNRDWARWGVPLGLALMLVVFASLWCRS